MADHKNYSRRAFLRTGSAAAGIGLTVPAALTAAIPAGSSHPAAPNVIARRSRPVVVASGNGHQYRNGGEHTCVETVFRAMTEGDDILV